MSEVLNQPDLYDDGQLYPEMLHARHVALQLLDSVLTRKIPLDQALDDSKDMTGLTARDRAFVRMVAATTLRRLGQIDDLIVTATDRPEAPNPPLLHHLLRMGVAQLMFMNVPDHAAVNTTVQLAESHGLARQKGFVNAVLRRMGREGRDWLARQDEARLNTPEWLMRIWIEDYGLRTAAEIGLANLAEAPLDITVKDQNKLSHWAETLEAVALPNGTLRRVSGGNVQDLTGYHDGMWWVQDASASLPAQLFGDIADKDVVDLCAAPGGKTAQMAAAGARVTALDKSARRIRRLDENMRRLRLDRNVKTEAADATVWQPREKAQFVLLDAPCTATGTIRRHPDVARLKSQTDQASLMETQARMLDNAVRMLTPGGVLIYCTCSLQKAEGEGQVEAALSRHSDLRRMPVMPEEIGGMTDLVSVLGDVRVLPFHMAAHGGMDGFYIARLTRS